MGKILKGYGVTSLLLLAAAGLAVFAMRDLFRQRQAGVPRAQGDRKVSGTPLPAPAADKPETAGPAPGAEDAERRRKALEAALDRYGDRPVVRDFFRDLKADPCAASAIASGKAQGRADMLVAARDAGCLEGLKKKYIFRPDFIRLAIDLRGDPELAPLLGRSSAGGTEKP